MEKINNISKAEALDYTKHFGEKVYVIERMVQSTFYGADYQNDFDDIYSMSYFCRAFNVTEYGASRQKNKIKGRYKKYAKVDGAEGYFRQILNAKWPGFKDENPRMDDLLARYPQENIFEKKQNPQPVSEPVQQPVRQQENTSSTPQTEGEPFPVEVIPVILLIIGAILLLKWNPVLVILLAIIGGVVYYQVKKGNHLRARGQTSSVRKIVLGVLGIFFTFLVIVGLKAALVDDSESFIMIIVYGILAALCFRGAAK